MNKPLIIGIALLLVDLASYKFSYDLSKFTSLGIGMLTLSIIFIGIGLLIQAKKLVR